MSHNIPLDGVGPGVPSRGPSGADGPKRPADAGRAERGGPAFEALLEELQSRARELEADSRSVEQPGELASAVDRAHESLEDALSIGEKLLEAYRKALTDTPVEEPDEAGP